MSEFIASESLTTIEARFLLPGEVFERKSVRYTVVNSPLTTDDVTHFSFIHSEDPTGDTNVTTLSLPSNLQVEIQGRWL